MLRRVSIAPAVYTSTLKKLEDWRAAHAEIRRLKSERDRRLIALENTCEGLRCELEAMAEGNPLIAALLDARRPDLEEPGAP